MTSVYHPENEGKDAIETKQAGVADLDAELLEENDDLKRQNIVAEQKELTPLEAFKWNVEGDQSPCEHCLSVLTQVVRLLTAAIQFLKSLPVYQTPMILPYHATVSQPCPGESKVLANLLT